MCFGSDAQPPHVPFDVAAAGTVSGHETILTSADGTSFRAYLAQPTTRTRVAIVILPDVFGLRPFYQQLAQRFAQAGIQALAIDFYGRTAGLTQQQRDETFDFWPHIAAVQTATIAQDIVAALTFLRTQTEPTVGALFTIGFCYGGATSFLQAASGQGLAGVIGFYGPPVITPSWQGPAPSVIDHTADFVCPLLGIFGGADTSIPAESIAEFDAALASARVTHELVTYPGAPHSFFDWGMPDYAEMCDDAWRRMLAFIHKSSDTIP
jgi:carboxymethylenebutenolidase